VEIPPGRLAEVRAVATVLGDEVLRRFPLVPGMRPVTLDPVEALLNNTWRPALAVTGVDGMPALADGGTVLRPKTWVNVSLRFPQAQFLVTGVMGPGSNAHGPNEFIDLPTGVKVTASVAQVLADHGTQAPSARR